MIMMMKRQKSTKTRKTQVRTVVMTAVTTAAKTPMTATMTKVSPQSLIIMKKEKLPKTIRSSDLLPFN